MDICKMPLRNKKTVAGIVCGNIQLSIREERQKVEIMRSKNLTHVEK